MGNWGDVLNEITAETSRAQAELVGAIDTIRRRHLQSLSAYTGRNTIAYYSGWLSKPKFEGTEIVDDDKNAFMTCIHRMDRSLGLDLILHTPGGNIAATESLAHYLREMFGQDIRAIVPQMAMSAGTMLACSCKVIIMGKQSNLGPIDPHINGIPADIAVNEFRRAFTDIQQDPAKAQVWAPILNRYHPTFLTQCEYAVEWSKRFVENCLLTNMFKDAADPRQTASDIVSKLSSANENKTHSKHLHYQDCKLVGLNIEMMEDDSTLQELILTVHHSYLHTTTNYPVAKIVENNAGQAVIRNVPLPGPGISFGFGGPTQPSGIPSDFSSPLGR